jgi:hypothetical protein
MINLDVKNSYLKNILPPTIISIDTSSWYPDEIIARLSELKKSHSSQPVALFNGDVWRYGTDPDLTEFLQNDHRVFYIFTLGYEHKIKAKNIAEISWPLFYFLRPKSNLASDVLTKRQHGFSCLNNKSAFHRLVLGCQLFNDRILDSLLFTQNVTSMPQGYHANILQQIIGMSEYISTLPRTCAFDDDRDFQNQSDMIEHPAFYDSYCNIVTETEMQEFVFEGPVIDLPIITEKSYKPFRAKQIPVWFAAPGHMCYLESLGFEVMNDLVPQDFDLTDVYDRSRLISDLVAKGHGFIQDFYHSHLRQIQHNYDLVQSDRVENLVIENLGVFLDQFHQQAY